MALKNYALRSPSVVILADERDPYVSWQHHLERTGGLRGGVDIVAKVGTPVYARTDGVMLHVPNDGSAGNSCRFEHLDNPGWRDVFSHLSRYVGVSGQHFNAGDIVAYTGNTGNVTEHLHWHLVDPSGVRRNPWDHFSGSTPAGGTGTIIDNEPQSEEDEMKPFLIYKNNTNGTRQWALVSGDLARMVPIGKLETANGLAALYGSAVLVVEPEWQAFAAAAGTA